MGEPADQKGFQAVDRALTILTSFSSRQQVRSVAELGQELGVHRSTLYRLLTALQRHDLVELAEGKIRPGLRLYELGCLAAQRLEIKPLAQPVLIRYAAQMPEATFSLAIYDRGDVLYLERVDSPYHTLVLAVAGGRIPAYAAGTGKVLLSAQDEEEVERVIRAGLHAFTQHTITDGGRLRAELAQVRRQGYAVIDQEVQLGDYGIAAPVYERSGKAVAAIGVSGAVSRIKPHQPQYLQTALDAAAEISKRLGHPSM